MLHEESLKQSGSVEIESKKNHKRKNIAKTSKTFVKQGRFFFQSILFQNSSRRQEFLFFRISFQKKKFILDFAFSVAKEGTPGSERL